MTKEFMQKMAALDEAAERAGGYVAYCPNPNEKYGLDSDALLAYCQEKGIDALDLTTDQRSMFILERSATTKILDPLPDIDVAIDYRGISRYSKEKGVAPSTLTIRELQQFIKPASAH